MKDQNMDTTEGQLGEPMNFIGVTFRNMDVGLHTFEQKWLKDSYVTKAHPTRLWQLTKIGILEHTA